MANIPVERSGGLPWWAWLLGLLALLLIGALVLSQCNDDEGVDTDVAVVSEDGVSTAGDFDDDAMDTDTTGDAGAMADDAMDSDGTVTAGATGAAITSLADLNRLMNDTAAGDLNGRAVTLTDVAVSNVVGDSTFFVGTGADRVLVVLENLGESQTGDGTGSDGVFNVDTGDRVTLNGRLERFSGTMRGLSGLTAADRTATEGRRYVVVTRRDGLSM